ncbi:MAG: MerR family transcriptional regulator [Ruminococcaceae bacterium]|nr:MerR family transcriptional regulator [Oscillospiraceae bacterium]
MSRQRTMDVILASEYVSIGELVRITGCRYSTLKFYTEENMLPFEQAEQNLTRRYRREETVKRIQWIKKLKEDGLSIPQIKNVLQTAPKKERGPD